MDARARHDGRSKCREALLGGLYLGGGRAVSFAGGWGGCVRGEKRKKASRAWRAEEGPAGARMVNEPSLQVYLLAAAVLQLRDRALLLQSRLLRGEGSESRSTQSAIVPDRPRFFFR